MPRETEIKLRVDSVAATRQILRRAGFRVAERRVFESNVIFDTPKGALRRQRRVLRLRVAGSRAILTFKGAPLAGRYKSREEIESGLSHPEAAAAILAGVGFTPVFRYEKYRTVYRNSSIPGLVMFDETPIGDFLEIEGSPRAIDRIARSFGFSPGDYLTASYGRLYLDDCREAGIVPRNMVFSGRR